MSFLILASLCGAILQVAPSTVAAQTATPAYTVGEIPTVSGGCCIRPRDVNANGQVVGEAQVPQASGTTWHAFLWQNDQLTDLGQLDGTSSWATSINVAGQIVGSVQTTTGVIAFLWQNGAMRDLNTLLPAGSDWRLQTANHISDGGVIVGEGVRAGRPSAYAFDLTSQGVTELGPLPPFTGSGANSGDDLGRSVGRSFDTSPSGDEQGHATLWQNGSPTDLGQVQPSFGPGGQAGSNIVSVANATSGDGRIVGTSYWGSQPSRRMEAFGFHAWVWYDGVLTDLGEGIAKGVNLSGQIVGGPFLWQNGQKSLLSALISPSAGWTIDNARAINNDGVIVGSGTHNGIGGQGFILTPVATAPPSITIINPLTNQTYSGSITVQAAATNASSVAFNVDGSAATAMSYNTTNGWWEGTLNTAAFSNSAHNVQVVNTGQNGATATDTAWNVTFANATTPAPVRSSSPSPSATASPTPTTSGPPTISIAKPVSNGTYSGTIHGAGERGKRKLGRPRGR